MLHLFMLGGGNTGPQQRLPSLSSRCRLVATYKAIFRKRFSGVYHQMSPDRAGVNILLLVGHTILSMSGRKRKKK